MRKKHVLTALAIFAVTGIGSHTQGFAEAWQGNAIKHLSGMMTNAASVNNEQQGQKSSTQLGGSEWESLIHRVGADAYSGMSTSNMRPGPMASPQGPTAGSQPLSTGEYKFSSPGNEGRYGSNPSDSYLKKESSGPSNGPYGGSLYGVVPSTPSADPMIKELNRDPSMR